MLSDQNADFDLKDVKLLMTNFNRKRHPLTK